MEEEARKREEMRIAEIRDKQKMEEMRKLMEAAGQDTSGLLAGGTLTDVDRKALEAEVRGKAAKAKEEEAKRRTEQVRRLDYLTRAVREAERARVEAFAASAVAGDVEYVAAAQAAAIAKAKARHEAAVSVKSRVVRMTPYMEAFEEAVEARRRKAAAADLVSCGVGLGGARVCRSSLVPGTPPACAPVPCPPARPPPPPALVKSILAVLRLASTRCWLGVPHCLFVGR